MKILLILLTLSFLACSTKESKPSNAVPLATLTLKQILKIPAQSARIYLQHGKVVASPNTFAAYCELEVNTVSDGNDTLNPNTFVASHSYSRRTTDTYTELPAINFYCRQPVYFEDHYTLNAQKPSDIRKMICRQYSDNNCAPLSTRQTVISRALGKQFTIQWQQP